MPLDYETEQETGYRVTLDVFFGPLDLLLYLIKKEEVDICDIPIARILDQYMKYLEAMKALDINVAGEFLVLASTLMEIKSRMLLPMPPETEEEKDPRAELVSRLLEYKRFKELGGSLMLLYQEQSLRYPRPVLETFPGGTPRASPEEVLKEVELWDLVSAFLRLTQETTLEAVYPITLEDISIEKFMEWILERLRVVNRIRFFELFGERPERGKVVGTFLALLELIRLGKVSAYQESPFGEISIEPRNLESEGDEK